MLYGGNLAPGIKSKIGGKMPLRALLAEAQAPDSNIRPVVAAFKQWSQARRSFFKDFVRSRTVWSPELTNKVY